MEKKKRIAVIGLGLMGGSLAYAVQGFEGCEVIGYDRNKSTMAQALAQGAIDCQAQSLCEAVREADIILYCSSPRTIIENMYQSFPFLQKGSIVSEICGVKKDIMQFVSQALPEGVHYIGIHPMTGKEVGGFENADAALYHHSNMIIVVPPKYDHGAMTRIRTLCTHIGVKHIVVNSQQEHDSIIAYTSDLMHIAAVGLCVEYPKEMRMVHTAGSFRDCTRIAKIDADLWTDLLRRNAEYILPHLRKYIGVLQSFEGALYNEDGQALHALLETGNQNKRDIENKGYHFRS